MAKKTVKKKPFTEEQEKRITEIVLLLLSQEVKDKSIFEHVAEGLDIADTELDKATEKFSKWLKKLGIDNSLKV